MKQTQAAAKAPKPKQAGSGGLRSYAKSLLDRVFLRSKIWEIRKEVRGLKRAMPELEQSLDLSVTLLSKKIDYLLAKIDAYADVDDANNAAILKRAGELAAKLDAQRGAGEGAVRTLQETLEARLETIGRSNAELAATLDAQRHADEDAVRGLHETLEARLETIGRSGVELAAALDAQRHADEDAARGRQETLEARLETIERSNAELAAALDAQRHAGEDATRGRDEKLSVRFAAIEESIARRMEVETAFREEVRSRYDALAARLTVIEMGNTALADRLEAMRRAEEKIGDAVDSSSRNLMARMDAGQTKLEAIEAAQTGNVAKIEKSVERIAFNEFRQFEALDTLRQLLKFDLPLPATRDWAASPDFLLHLYRHIVTHRPKVVVELGSGVSTLVIAAALAANGDGGRIQSLDHEEPYARATAELLAQHGFSDMVTVHYAPLGLWKPSRPTKLGTEWQWYTVPGEVSALEGIDLLVVDGPPGNSCPYARYPAVPYFRAQMSSDCLVLMDDARRPDEKEIASAWDTDWRMQYNHLHKFEKGLASLTVTSKSEMPYS